MSAGKPGEKKPIVGLPPAEALALKDLIDYGAGAVVSRTLMKNDVGTVTLFSFAKGEGLSEHSAPFDALVLVLDGGGEFTIGGRKVSVAAGQAVLMPAHEPHAVHAAEPFKMLLVMLKG